MLRIILGILMIFIVFMGYYFELSKKYEIDIYQMPAIIISGIVSVLFIGGILNFLLFSVVLVTFGGFFFFIKNIKTAKYVKIRTIPLLFVITMGVYLIYYYYGALYENGDTLTFWARIVRDLYRDNRFPNFTNADVFVYQSYPPAAACWIYYFSKVVGFSEGICLCAQSVWILSCGLCVLSLSRNNICDAIICLISVIVLVINNPMDGLSVDTLLSMVFVAAICVVEKHSKKRDIFLLIPFLISITTIKNSGIFFAMFLVIYCIFVCKKEISFKEIITTLSIPVATLVIWSRHINMVYDKPEASRHSISTSSMLKIFSERPFSFIRTLIHNYLLKWLSFNKSWEWHVNLLGIAIFCLGLLLYKKNEVQIKRFVFAICMYGTYKIMLLLMYMFNMPGGEARQMVSYERYQLSMTVVLFYLVIVILFNNYDFESRYRNSKQIINALSVMLLIIAMSVSIITNTYKKYIRPDYKNDGAHRVITNELRNKNLPKDSNILLYAKDSFIIGIHSEYSFDSNNVTSTYSISDIEEAVSKNANNYDYIYILDHNYEVDSVIYDYGFDKDQSLLFLK